jgi:hypothetical protein
MNLEEILARDEELHPDLQARLVATDYGTILHHPLVVELMPFPALANLRYQQKRESLQSALDAGLYRQSVWLYERPYRLDGFQAVAHLLDDETYWSLLAELWVDSESIGQTADEWVEMLDSTRPGSMMSPEEAEALAALPERIEVFRGAVEGVNEDGLSWTLDRERAEWFAGRFAAEGDVPLVLVGEVARADVAALLTGRGEDEIVVRDPGVVDVLRVVEV